jgi:tRNA (guanine37-N1)-methyltransferase
MHIDVFSLFPEVFESYLNTSILKRAQDSKAIDIDLHNFRDFAKDKHKIVDDTPFGGEGGMVLKPEPIFDALEKVLGNPPKKPVILLTPQGELFDQEMAFELSRMEGFALLCGRYEGVDERIREQVVSREISVGDYVLTGGELPALTIIDAVARLLPGVLGDANAPQKDSHAQGLLEHPHYTRPAIFREWEVPEVLRLGNHAEIKNWRRQQSLLRTAQRRPELLSKGQLNDAEKDYLRKLGYEEWL